MGARRSSGWQDISSCAEEVSPTNPLIFGLPGFGARGRRADFLAFGPRALVKAGQFPHGRFFWGRRTFQLPYGTPRSRLRGRCWDKFIDILSRSRPNHFTLPISSIRDSTIHEMRTLGARGARPKPTRRIADRDACATAGVSARPGLSAHQHAWLRMNASGGKRAKASRSKMGEEARRPLC